MEKELCEIEEMRRKMIEQRKITENHKQKEKKTKQVEKNRSKNIKAKMPKTNM